MADVKVFFVHLRRPRTASVAPKEQRNDPYYEFGSFGCTGCHSKNLFHRRHAADLEGARLAFVQGGSLGFRLVYLTPTITVKVWNDHCEARWSPAEMPFKYTAAPILIRNPDHSDFPLVKAFAEHTERSTLEAGLSSRIRSRATPMPAAMADQVIRIYQRLRNKVPQSAIATTYDQALPSPPPKINRNRKATYQNRIRALKDNADRPVCGSKRGRNCG